MIGEGNENKIKIIESQDFPVSVGILYTAFTQFLGFPYYGDEYKVMGLSPYGKPTYINDFRKIMWSGKKNILEWDTDFFDLSKGAIHYENNIPKVFKLFSTEKFTEKFGKPRKFKEEISDNHKNIASSLQRRTEEIIFEILSEKR